MRRPNAQITILLCTCAAALALPAVGWASSGGSSSGGGSPSGGSGYQSGGTGSGGQGGGPTTATPVGGSVSSSANGMTISTRPATFLSGRLVLRGRVPARDAGDAVELERSGPQTGGQWTPTVSGTVESNGSFALAWRTNHVGRFEIRALLERSHAARNASGWPTVTVTVYQSATATFYGPGFYGRRTACGEVLHKQTLGVANRTLPCGTQVSIYYRGKTITVPVIDRGPYSNDASWDLTEATAHALGMDGTATIGAASVPRSS